MAPSGGSELNAVRTAEQLQARGHSIVTLTLTDDRSGMYDRYQASGIEVLGFPVDSLVGRSAVRQVRAMARSLRELRPDVVHTHDSYTNFLMVAAARLARLPVIASKRYVEQYQPQHRLTDRIAFGLAHLVLANSEQVRASAIRRESVSPSRVVVVPNFVDDELFGDTSDLRSEWRERLQLPPDATVVAIVAQLRREKQHDVLLEAFSRVSESRSNFHLVIAGDGPERQNIESMVDQLQLTGRVTMAGHVSKAWRVFAAADVAVLPSLHEGFPNAIVEAMAMGLPIVASSVGGILDAVRHEANGLLVPPGDAAALAQALDRMYSDVPFRQSARMESRRIAESRFRAEPVISGLESIYRQLAGSSS